eukprot:gene2542-2060_t
MLNTTSEMQTLADCIPRMVQGAIDGDESIDRAFASRIKRAWISFSSQLRQELTDVADLFSLRRVKVEGDQRAISNELYKMHLDKLGLATKENLKLVTESWHEVKVNSLDNNDDSSDEL